MTHDDDETLTGCLILIGAILTVWLIYSGFPVSLYCLGAAALAWMSGIMGGVDGTARRYGPLRERLILGLFWDTSRVLWWLAAGFAVVWAAQIFLRLFRSRIDHERMLSAELVLYDLARRIEHFTSIENAALALLAALLLAIILNSLSPVALLGRARRALAVAIAFLTAATAFTFVTAPTAAARYDLAAGPLRVAIAADLQRAALARRQQAALQWLIAELPRERDDFAYWRARYVWDGFFRATNFACIQDPDQLQGSEEDLLALKQSLRAICPPKAATGGGLDARTVSAWLPEFTALIRPLPAAERVSVTRGEPAFTIAPTPRLSQLEQMRSRVQRAATSEEQARDALRTTAVDMIGHLFGTGSVELIGQVVDVWRDRLVDSMIGESMAQVERRVGALLSRRRGAAAPSATALRAAANFPLDRMASVSAERIEAFEAAERTKAPRSCNCVIR